MVRPQCFTSTMSVLRPDRSQSRRGGPRADPRCHGGDDRSATFE